MIMKKWLSHFAYNQRSRSGWTLEHPLKNTSKSNLIGQKTVTYVPGTFVTLVPGPNTPFAKGEKAANNLLASDDRCCKRTYVNTGLVT